MPGTEVGAGEYINLLALEGLTAVNVDGRPTGRIAQSWSWEAEGHRLRIRLRPRVLFHDGTPADAATLVPILTRLTSNAANFVRYPALADVTSVRAEGTSEILIEVARPSALLPEDLSAPLAKDRTPIGTGPYRILTRTPSELSLARFEQYYQGVPAVSRVQLKPVDTLRTAWSSLLRGEVDMVSDVPADATEFIRNDDVQVVSFRRWYQYLVAFNARKSPFDQPAVRRAMNLAVDRGALIREVLRESGTPSTGPLWPRFWAYDTSLSGFGYDPAAARALLDAAQLPARSATGAGSRTVRFRFDCLVPAGFAVWERIALQIQRNLYDVGIDMQFSVVPFEQFDARVRDGNFDAALIDMISGPTPWRTYIFWRSQRTFQGLNVFAYENPRVEEAFDILRETGNEAAIRTTTRRLQELFLQDPPALFLAWNMRTRALSRDFVVPNEPERDPMSQLWRWTARSRDLANR